MIVDEDIQKQSLGIMGFAIDSNGIVLSVGEGIAKLVGFREKDIIGKNFSVFIHPDDEKDLWLSFQKDLEGILEPAVFRLITKNGNYIQVRTFSQPILDGDKVIRVEGIMTEI
jgi:PAS domain S-box-containing protein